MAIRQKINAVHVSGTLACCVIVPGCRKRPLGKGSLTISRTRVNLANWSLQNQANKYVRQTLADILEEKSASLLINYSTCRLNVHLLNVP